MSREETVRRALIVSLFFLVPAFKVLDPVMFDPDIWWHLKTGEWIVRHGAVPQTDPFSQHGMGQPWMAYSWLFEVFVFGLHRALGMSGIILYQLVMAFAIVAAMQRLIFKRESRFVAAAALVFLVVFCLYPVLTPRPWLFSILFFILTLDLVLDMREGRPARWMWLLPPVYALWANLHIQFLYGLFVLSLACVAPYAERLWARINPGAPVSGREPDRRMFGIALACGAATLLTPYHIHLYETILWYITHTGQYGYVSEMAAPGFREPASWLMVALAGLAAAALGRHRSRSIFLILLLIVASACAFRAIRDIWFLAIASAVVIAATGRDDTQDRQPGSGVATSPRIALAICITVGAMVPAVWMIRSISERRIQAEIAKIFPAAAAEAVESRGYSGPLYNHFNWGGYLIWRLPQLPVSIDGRVPVYGDKFCLQALSVWNGKSNWSSDTTLAAANLVIAQKNMPLASLLKLDPRFELVYSDTLAAVFISRPQPLPSDL